MHTFLILFALSIAQAPAPDLHTIEGTVVAIADGDTLTVLDDTKTQFKIRLIGIDAPEKNQAFGTASKNALSEYVTGKPVTVKWSTRDRYERILGEVTVDGESINLKMVENGHAWQYRQYDKSERLANAEAVARRDRKGLWADDKPTPPSEFRATEKAKSKAKSKQAAC